MSATLGFPIVNVPVLSKTIVSTLLKACITSLPFNRTPFRAPLPMPATLDTGTPITKAPGHPKTKIVIASSISREISQTIMAKTKTTGV